MIELSKKETGKVLFKNNHDSFCEFPRNFTEFLREKKSR